jgi:hypothetical protein
MATFQEEEAARDKLKGILNELNAINPAELVRDKELGPGLSFEPGVIFFSRTLRLFRALSEADLQDISFQKITQTLQFATETRDQFRRITDFSLQKYPNNPIGTRDEIINQIRDWYDRVFEILAPIVAFTVRKGTDFERLEEQAKAALKRIDAFSGDQEQALQKARSNAEQLVEEVRRIAQESGVSQHAIYFKQEADEHQTGANRWLQATIWLALTTTLLGVVFVVIYLYRVTNLTPTQNLQVLIPKILVFSVLFSATIWAGRTYRAHRHNAVINRHRQNALSTFQTFAKAASDDQTKNAVLLQATQCIFSPQQTGYISGEVEAGAVPQVLEIIRNLGPKTGG